MKNSAMFFLTITTIVLVVLVFLVALNIPFSWVFYLTCIGQLLLIITVYKVLRDSYTTDKTFKDFYEDVPKGNYR